MSRMIVSLRFFMAVVVVAMFIAFLLSVYSPNQNERDYALFGLFFSGVIICILGVAHRSHELRHIRSEHAAAMAKQVADTRAHEAQLKATVHIISQDELPDGKYLVMAVGESGRHFLVQADGFLSGNYYAVTLKEGATPKEDEYFFKSTKSGSQIKTGEAPYSVEDFDLDEDDEPALFGTDLGPSETSDVIL